jgi:hypothetical protein
MTKNRKILFCLTLMGAVMLKLILAISILIAPGYALAQTECNTDSFGTTHCQGSGDSGFEAYTDSFGTTHFRNNDGSSATSDTDSFGTTRYQSSDGSSVEANTDSFGTTRYQGSDGSSVEANTDSFGTTRYQGSDGSSAEANTDSFGTTRYQVSNGGSARPYTPPSNRGTGIDVGAFSRGAAQAKADFNRDQQMQQNAVMQDLQVQQMLRNSQHQQYENLANTYLSTVPELRQKTLAKGMSECGFWQALGRRIGSDQNFKSWPKEQQTIIAGKLGEMVLQATDGKGCIENTQKNKKKKTVK